MYLKSKLLSSFYKKKITCTLICLSPVSLIPEHTTKIIEGHLRIEVNITERKNCYFSTSKQKKKAKTAPRKLQFCLL